MLAKRSGPPLGKGTGVTPPGPHNLMRARPGGGRGALPGHVGCFPGQAWGGHGFLPCPGIATHSQPGALGSALNLASPLATDGCRTGYSDPKKWGELRDCYVE